MTRIIQQQIVPTQIKGRHLGEVIYIDNIQEGTVSVFNLPDATSVLVTYTLTNNFLEEVIGVNYLSVYLNSVDPTNRIPGGSAIDETDYILIIPQYSYSRWELVEFVPYKEIAQLFLQNASGGNIDLVFKNKWKYMSQRKIAKDV